METVDAIALFFWETNCLKLAASRVALSMKDKQSQMTFKSPQRWWEDDVHPSSPHQPIISTSHSSSSTRCSTSTPNPCYSLPRRCWFSSKTRPYLITKSSNDRWRLSFSATYTATLFATSQIWFKIDVGSDVIPCFDCNKISIEWKTRHFVFASKSGRQSVI